MSKSIHHRIKELMMEQGMTEDALRPMEFFFYADNEDDASNLAIDLAALKYKIYGICPPCREIERCSIDGHTPMMSTAAEALAAWYEEMSELAIANNCEFDGYGTLITEPEEGWDELMNS